MHHFTHAVSLWQGAVNILTEPLRLKTNLRWLLKTAYKYIHCYLSYLKIISSISNASMCHAIAIWNHHYTWPVLAY